MDVPEVAPNPYIENNAYLFECQMHKSKSFENFNLYRKNDTLCDVTIKVGSSLFRAHRVVLSAPSPYFQAMFTAGLREGAAEIIELFDVNAESISVLLDFIYTSRLLITEDNVQRILPACNLLQLTTVRDACSDFLMQQLDPCNVLGILLFADTHNCNDLVAAAEKFVLQNFISVSKTEEFQALNLDRIRQLLSSDNLIVEDESSVYLALIQWLKHEIEIRKQHTAQLLGCVRLPLLNRDFLMLTVEPEDLIKFNPQCKDLLIEAMKYHLMPEMRRYLQTFRTKPRTGKYTSPVMFALGGQNLFAIHCECERYNNEQEPWSLIPPMAIRRSRLGVGVVYNKLYAVGGFDGLQDLSSMEIFNMNNKIWSSGLQMGTARSCLGVAVLHNLIYAVGGYDGSSCLSSVERYDPLSNQWTSVAKMNSRRRYVSVGVIDEHIIAAGGYDGYAHLDSCEIFDPVSNIWTTKATMKTQRSSAGGCVLNGYFYVSGGTDGSVIVISVERYDMQNDQWTNIRQMSSVRMTHALIVLDAKLYAIGGNDGTTSLNSVDEYDPQQDVWAQKAPMSTRRSHTAAVVLLVNPQ